MQNKPKDLAWWQTKIGEVFIVIGNKESFTGMKALEDTVESVDAVLYLVNGATYGSFHPDLIRLKEQSR